MAAISENSVMAIPKIISLPKIEDARGNLSVIEKDVVPFHFKRVFYLYDVPSGSNRGGHALISQQQFIIALSGSFDVILDDGQEKRKYTLNRPDMGLLIPNGYWRELENFSAGGICLVLASAVYNEADYIRDYEDFVDFKTK